MVFLNILQISQKNTCVELSLSLQDCKFIKKCLLHWYFPVESVNLLRTSILKKICEFLWVLQKFVRTAFLQNTTRRLLLIIAISIVVKGELANEFVNWDISICKEAVAKRGSVKKVFLEISQNSQENTCARVFF